MKQKYFLNNISEVKISIKKPFLIFLRGDLGTGKTTFSKYLLNNVLKVKDNVISPTYTYYNEYYGEFAGEKVKIIHFDLYRIKNYDEFFSIAGEDIIDNNTGIILVEWPEIITSYYKADLEINFNTTSIENEREITLKYN